MAIPKLTDDLEFIAKLGDNPNTDNNMSSAELKAQFDKAAGIIKTFINGYIVPAVNSYISETSFLPLVGGTMKGLLKMGGFKIKDLGAPTADTDAANKAYVDNRVTPLSKGGTGATTAAQARKNLGAAPSGYGAYGEAVPVIGTFATEAELEAALQTVFSAMVNNETRRIRFAVEDLGASPWTGTIFRSSDSYAILEATSGISNHVNQFTKTLSAGVWTPGEWLNPPLAKGVRYRTMERYNKSAVYAELDSEGKLHKYLENGTEITLQCSADLKAQLAAGMTVLSSYQYGDTLPTTAPKGALFFLKVSD